MSTGRGKTIIYLRKTEAEYFSPEDWTGESALNFLAKFVPARAGFSGIPGALKDGGPSVKDLQIVAKHKRRRKTFM